MSTSIPDRLILKSFCNNMRPPATETRKMAPLRNQVIKTSKILFKIISLSIVICNVTIATSSSPQSTFKSGGVEGMTGSLMSIVSNRQNVEHIHQPSPSLTASLITIKSPTNNNNQNHYHHQGGNQNHDTRHQSNINVNNNLQQPQHASLISAPPTQTTINNNNLPTCQLPQTWAGRWYQANKEPIRVTNTEISDKGICRDQKGDKFLFENYNSKSTNSQPCLVCLVINERHLNVLQYKESNCQQLPPNYYNRSSITSNQIIQSSSSSSIDDDHSLLDSICSDINGDAQLESLFRLDTPSIECPISGQYALSYDNCRDPLSSLDSCIDKKQLNFKYSACPDVPGSESKYEVLKCYADWSEGNNYYMVGRLEHASNPSERGKFRCFLYEKSPDGKLITMSQSLEENFYGLYNPNDGPKTLRLTSRPPTTNNKCSFPAYIMNQSENWLSVDNFLVYMFNQNSTKYQVKETKDGNVIEEATCLQQFNHPASTNSNHQYQLKQQQQARNPLIIQPSSRQTINRRHSSATSFNQPQTTTAQANYLQQQQVRGSDTVYLVQISKNCHTTNYCVRFHKRTSGIVQIDYFLHSPSDSTCRSAFVDAPQTQIITSTNLEHQRCPFEGAYTIEAPPETDLTYNPSNIFLCPRQSFLTSQCDQPSRLRIHSKCSPGRLTTKNLNCLGSWTTDGLVRLLLVDDERQRYSAWYRVYSGLLGGPQTTTAAAAPPGSDLAPGAGQDPSSAPVPLLTPIIDLQIALLTKLPVVTKPMPVRLTRRHHCSELLAPNQQQQQMASSAQNYHHQQQTMSNAYGLSPNNNNNNPPNGYFPPISSPSFSIIGNGGGPSSAAASKSASNLNPPDLFNCTTLIMMLTTLLFVTIFNPK